jgi:hypothetical protein
MGIDPLDGGDSRRGITASDNRSFSVIGRDTVFTLCDGTDRAIVTVNDAKIVNSALVSDNLVIACTNNNSTVKLKVRYDVIDKNIIRETVTSQSGDPVDKSIFHRVSDPDHISSRATWLGLKSPKNVRRSPTTTSGTSSAA